MAAVAVAAAVVALAAVNLSDALIGGIANPIISAISAVEPYGGRGAGAAAGASYIFHSAL